MSGVLPDQAIRQLIADNRIAATRPIQKEQVQPASLDLRLGGTAYRVRASFLAGRESRVSVRFKLFVLLLVDLGDWAVLEKGCVYVVPLLE